MRCLHTHTHTCLQGKNNKATKAPKWEITECCAHNIQDTNEIDISHTLISCCWQNNHLSAFHVIFVHFIWYILSLWLRSGYFAADSDACVSKNCLLSRWLIEFSYGGYILQQNHLRPTESWRCAYTIRKQYRHTYTLSPHSIMLSFGSVCLLFFFVRINFCSPPHSTHTHKALPGTHLINDVEGQEVELSE